MGRTNESITTPKHKCRVNAWVVDMASREAAAVDCKLMIGRYSVCAVIISFSLESYWYNEHGTRILDKGRAKASRILFGQGFLLYKRNPWFVWPTRTLILIIDILLN